MFEVLKWVVGAWWLPIGVGVLIAFWATRSLRRFEMEIGRVSASLRRATQRLAAIESARGFVAAYEDISSDFSADPVLGAAWTEFESTLILPTDHALVRNTRRPGEFFNDALYYKSGINLREFESIPNQLVGWGLLATFVGLVLSLLVAQQGIGADIQTAKAALAALLSAAAFKFLTSIFALGSSVVYVGAKNRVLHKTDEELEIFCRELERLTLQVTSESLAAQSHLELSEQTKQLERFNSELAISIAEALDGKLRTSLGEAMQPIAIEIGNLAERLGQINQDALEQMVDRFSSELSGAAREHTDQMARMLKAAAESIAAVPGHIDAAGLRFGEQIEAGANELSASMTAAAENMDATLQRSMRGLTESVAASAANLGAVAADMEASLGRQQTFTEGLKQAQNYVLARLGDVLSAVNETAEKLTTLVSEIASIGEASGKLSGLADNLGSASNALATTSERLAQLADHTEALNSRAAQTVAALVERVSHVEREVAAMNNALSASFDKVAGGVGQFGEKTTTFVKELDKALADALGRLSGAVQQLDEAVGELPKRADFAQLSRAIAQARREPVE